MPCCYILYSQSVDQFYVGITLESFEMRLNSHNTGKYTKSFTSKSNDWVEFLIIQVESYDHARRIELHIKKMKSRTYILNLKKYPELRNKLVERTKV